MQCVSVSLVLRRLSYERGFGCELLVMRVQAWISFSFCTLLLFSIYLFSRNCIFGPPGFFTVPSPFFYLISSLLIPGLHGGDPHLPPPPPPLSPIPRSAPAWSGSRLRLRCRLLVSVQAWVLCRVFVCSVFPFKFLPWRPISIVGMTLLLPASKRTVDGC